MREVAKIGVDQGWVPRALPDVRMFACSVTCEFGLRLRAG
jgi:hypothetical protein